MNGIKIKNLNISKLVLGGNPFSGISHQTPSKDLEMKQYYTTERIKTTLRQAESLGINTFIARSDNHIIRILLEYWNEGGKIQWIAQTCPEYKNIIYGIDKAVNSGAKACYIHGGQLEYFLANNKPEKIFKAVEKIISGKMPVGIAGHDPKVVDWAEKNVNADFYMCSYYNPSRRDKQPQLVPGMKEWFKPEDRDVMVNVINRLSKPVIHYKIMAAGRNNPKESFDFVSKHIRPQDAVCVGVYTKDNPEMIKENVELLESNLKE